MSALFGKVCQNGYVVRDIVSAMKFWTEVHARRPVLLYPEGQDRLVSLSRARFSRSR